LKQRYVDAHNHLHDKRFGAYHEEAIAQCEEVGVVASVVNGTSPEDWSCVAELAKRYQWILPSYGVHPWYVDRAQDGWLTTLRNLLSSRPSVIGEIGIDHWKVGLDRELQERVFIEQLKLAIELNLPASIHGLKAWGRLLELLQTHGAPKRGFLLHSYSGPAELIQPFVELGAFFSCPPALFDPSRARRLEIFRSIPQERILPETDAPDQGLSAEDDSAAWRDSDGKPLNNPSSMVVVYRGLSALLNVPGQELCERFERSFRSLFTEAR
jgi:TatD DNase family protein